jgi:aminoglycoside phosphotransferase (APT) family kinase protein
MQPRWDSIVQALSAAPQRVHGDVHGGNILTHGRKATGIIDCDHLPLAPRGYDLGYYMAFGVQWRLAASHRRQPTRPCWSSPATCFIREHDLVEESWLRTACWIGDNFDVLRL